MLILGILPVLDIFRWESESAGWAAFTLRLPLIFVPFILLQLSAYWPYYWRKLALLAMLISLTFSIVLYLWQGPAYIFEAIRSDNEKLLYGFINRPYYGFLCGIMVLLLIREFYSKDKSVIVIFSILSIGFQFLILTKLSLFALGVCLFIFYFYTIWNSHLLRNISLVFVFTGLLFGCYKVVNSRAFQELTSRGDISFTTLPKEYVNSLNTRLILWKASIDLLAENQNWVFGLGTATYQSAMDAKVEKYNGYTASQHLNPHNLVLYMAVQYGIAGIVLIFWFFGMLFRAAIKERDLLMGLVALFFFLSVQTENYYDRELGVQLWIWIVFVVFWDRKLKKQNFEFK
jgi:O-antigen ligase